MCQTVFFAKVCQNIFFAKVCQNVFFAKVCQHIFFAKVCQTKSARQKPVKNFRLTQKQHDRFPFLEKERPILSNTGGSRRRQ